MATTVLCPTTLEQALTTAYLGSDLEFTGAESVTLWLDTSVGFTVRFQFAGGDQIEDTYAAGTRLPITVGRGKRLLLNVKAAAGTPNAVFYAE